MQVEIPEPPPTNRLFQQIIRDGHLTFNKKLRDLVMQIYGHEGLVAEADTADIAHCSVFDIDFYRLNSIRWEHLTKRKLGNPFKLAEFLIVGFLELFSWSLQRLISVIAKAETARAKGNNPRGDCALFFLHLFLAFLHFFSTLINLAVNIITGTVRRFIAPVRYLIRPAIETARKYPQYFEVIVLITLGAAIFQTITILANTSSMGLLDDFFLTNQSGELIVKLVAVAFMSISLGAFLTKGFNTLCDLRAGFFSPRASVRAQMLGVDERNQKTDYSINILNINEEFVGKTTEMLEQEYCTRIPLLIKDSENRIFIYGRSPEGEISCRGLNSSVYLRSLFEGSKIDKIIERKPDQIHWSIYETINIANGHTPLKVGFTEKIAETLHGIDIAHVKLRTPEKQDFLYTAALYIGAESICYSR